MNKTESNTSGKWTFYDTVLVVVGFIAAAISGPVHNWYEKTIICTSTNPFSPLDPGLVNAVLKSAFGIAALAMLVLTVMLSKQLSQKRRLAMALACVAILFFTGSLFSSGIQKMERVTATDADTVRFNQWWCERRAAEE